MGLTMLTGIHAQTIEDEDITFAIDTELAINDNVPSHLIDVITSEGIVTLEGTTDHILAKTRAEEIAKTIKGVRSVINKIKVKPVDRSDKDIQKDVKEALLEDPVAESFDITIDVNNGLVRIKGIVNSWQEKQLVETTVKGVKGVRKVKNNLNIRYKSNRTDFEIKEEIQARLLNDVWIDAALIDVDVENGDVKLRGSVGSAYEKDRAKSVSWVAGTKSVDAHQLKVEWWARDKMKKKETVTYFNDDRIEQAIKDAFLYDPRVYSYNLNIESENGKVVLSGKVKNRKAKKVAEKDALNTRGVWRVINHIKVRPANIPDDETLKNRVENALMRDPIVEIFDLSVDAMNGRIMLNGKVNTSFEKKHAASVATSVRGVVKVDNNIDADYIWIHKSDVAIKQDIMDQYDWSPYVDPDDITVKVNEGIVTLTGKVDTWKERKSAEKNAYQGGAKDVQNDLLIKNAWYPFNPSRLK
jgi:osmotically-inducible protein OsmY